MSLVKKLLNQTKKKDENLDIILGFSARDKWEAIEKIIKQLAKIHSIEKVDQLLEEVNIREKQISTGMEYGVAMPHVKTSLVDETICVVVVAKDGIEFESFDESLSTIIVMILSPFDKLEEHVKTMAKFSKILSKEENRKIILSAQNINDIYKVFV